jgi:YHS domain-containing protein
MLFLLWLLRVLIILLIVRYIVAFFTRRVPAPAPPRAPSRPSERTGGTLVRDPQCGTYVPESGALALTQGGATWHFCSTTCRDAWALAHPK